MTSHRPLMTTAAASAIALLLVSNALADVSANAVLEGVQRQFAVQGVELTADSAELRGGDVLLSGVAIAGPEGRGNIELEQLLLEDVSEAGNGGFVVGRIAAPSFSSEQDGYTIAFEGAVIEGAFIAGPDEQDPIVKGGLYRAITIGGVAVAKGNAPVFTLQGATATMSPYEPGGVIDSKIEVKDFSVDFTQVDDPKARASMTELGYSTLTGRMSGEGSWNLGNGDLTWDHAVVLDDAATLNIDVAVKGYTAELVAGMQQMNEQMMGQSNQAAGLAMLGLMQQLQIGGLSIEIVDDSATGRILDFAAKQQGTTRDSIVAQAKGVLPVALAQLQNPQFAASVSAAVGAFLDNPVSLKIAAAPASPVPVAQIMGAAMAAPQSVIGILGVKITANE